MRRTLLMIVPLLALSSSAFAWDAGGSVSGRRAELERRAAAAGPGGLARVKAALLTKDDAPAWTKKTVWQAKSDGRAYVYGVGMVAGIRNAPLAVAAAENRARSTLVRFRKGAETKRAKTPNGSSSSTVIKGTLEGAAVLDLYRSPEGQTFALLAVPR